MFAESLFPSAANTEIWVGLEFRRPIYGEAQVVESHAFAGDLAAPRFSPKSPFGNSKARDLLAGYGPGRRGREGKFRKEAQPPFCL